MTDNTAIAVIVVAFIALIAFVCWLCVRCQGTERRKEQRYYSGDYSSKTTTCTYRTEADGRKGGGRQGQANRRKKSGKRGAENNAVS